MGGQDRKRPQPALRVAPFSRPHQGRFAPLRGALRASLTRPPARRCGELQGRDEEQGFSGRTRNIG